MGTFVRNEIAKNLAYFRKEKKLTQEDLGQQLGVKRNTVSSWESGINAIDVEVLFQICQILNVSVSDLFGKFANSSANELSV
jgi:transcriptional regulator with XRE-family HTH domain